MALRNCLPAHEEHAAGPEYHESDHKWVQPDATAEPRLISIARESTEQMLGKRVPRIRPVQPNSCLLNFSDDLGLNRVRGPRPSLLLDIRPEATQALLARQGRNEVENLHYDRGIQSRR
jgi:hypothetical protein